MSRRGIDRHELYERAVQSPRLQARFLRALHPAGASGAPLALGEDFSAAGALARAWVGAGPGGRAVCVDHDPAPLARLKALAPAGAVDIRCADVLAVDEPVDILAVLNFSICEWKTRAGLVAYLRHARARIRPGGLFVCDLYGGADAFALGESEAEIRDEEPLPGDAPRTEAEAEARGGAAPLRYIWEQREADPLTGRVVNAMHFVFDDGSALRDAFVYDWRLWSVPELRDALDEAGFRSTEVHDRLGDAVDAEGNLYVRPVDSPDELDENYVVYVVARI